MAKVGAARASSDWCLAVAHVCRRSGPRWRRSSTAAPLSAGAGPPQASVGTRVGTKWEQVVSPRGSSCPLVSLENQRLCREFPMRTGSTRPLGPPSTEPKVTGSNPVGRAKQDGLSVIVSRAFTLWVYQGLPKLSHPSGHRPDQQPPSAQWGSPRPRTGRTLGAQALRGIERSDLFILVWSRWLCASDWVPERNPTCAGAQGGRRARVAGDLPGCS
jgi:hypothetical protein